MMVALSASTLWILISLILGFILLPLRRNRSLYGLLNLGRWILLPYIAILLGYISPRLMGLTNLDWSTTFGVGLGVCFGLLALTAVAKVTNSRTNTSFSGRPTSNHHVTLGRISAHMQPSQWIWIALCACMQEFHWAFLRAGIWESLLKVPTPLEFPIYSALLIAGTLAMLELFLHSRTGEEWVGMLVTLLFTSILFLSTRNIYLCCLLHVGMAFLLPLFRSNHLDGITNSV